MVGGPLIRCLLSSPTARRSLAAFRPFCTRILDPCRLRNVIVISHGTTPIPLMDPILRQCGLHLHPVDSISVPPSKVTCVFWKDIELNIVDTPSANPHIAVEVERVVGMVEGAVLVVDAGEGPLAQTKFVLTKALNYGLRPILLLNRVEEPSVSEERCDEVESLVFDLFAKLGASEEQLDFPILYASAKEGWASLKYTKRPPEEARNMSELLDTIVRHVPPPKTSFDAPFQMVVSMIEQDFYLGRILTGRISHGIICVGDKVHGLCCANDGVQRIEDGKVSKLMKKKGTIMVLMDSAGAGDIVSMTGLSIPAIGHTIASTELTAGKISDDWVLAEAEKNLTVNVTSGSSEVHGRGKLQLGILIENIRREGFEFSILPPEVMLKSEEGQKLEPLEEVTIEVREEHLGSIMESLSHRRAEVVNMGPVPGHIRRIRLCITCPSRLVNTYSPSIISSALFPPPPSAGAAAAVLKVNKSGGDVGDMNVDADLTSHLFSILSLPNWQRHPSLMKLLTHISPTHVASLFSIQNLHPQTAVNFFDFVARRPNFTHNPHSHFALLTLLLQSKRFSAAERIRSSMIQTCINQDEIRFVLEVLTKLCLDDFKLNLKCYNLLLQSLSRFALIDDMLSLYKSMIQCNILPNIYTYNTMLNAYCKLGKVVEAQLYFTKIVQDGFNPDTFTYSSLILGYCRSKDIDKAYRVFASMPKKGCQRNEVSYNYIIHGLCEHDRFDEAFKLFSEMKEDNCFPNVRTYTVIISALFKLGRSSEAISLFDQMSKDGCKPNVHTYTVLIDNMCKVNKLDEARRLLDKMYEIKLFPKVITFNALIDGYCKVERIGDAFQILNLMELRNCIPNVRTYNELICGLCRTKKVPVAMVLFDKMTKRNLIPCPVTYNLLIQGQCKDGHFDSAIRLLQMMKDSSVKPDHWTYSILIDNLCKKGMVEDARALFDSLEDEGLKANSAIFSVLINGYSKNGNLESAQALFYQMLDEDNVLPNSWVYNTLIDGLCSEGKMEEALLILEKMVKAHVKADVVTYSEIIKGFLKDSSFDQAHKIFDQMVSMGLKPDACTYTAFIHAYCEEGNMEEAENLINKMTAACVLPDMITYTVLIDGYARSRSLNHAFGALKRMIVGGCEPSFSTYSILINHLLIEKKSAGRVIGESLASNSVVADVWKMVDLQTVLDLVENIQMLGVALPTGMYNTLVTGFCHQGRSEEALSIVNRMTHEGIPPSENIINSLIKCYCIAGLFDDAFTWVETLVEKRQLPHLESYKLLICGLYEVGKIAKAKSAFSSLLKCGYNNDEVVWKLMLDGLLQSGHSDRCSELLNIMENMGCRPNHQTYSKLIEGILSCSEGTQEHNSC